MSRTSRAAWVPLVMMLGVAAGCSGPDEGGPPTEPAPIGQNPVAPAANEPLTGQARVLFDQAMARLGEGDFEGAMQLGVQALSLSPGSVEPYRLLSKIMTDAGRDAQAIELFAEIAAQYPDQGHPWFYKGFHEFHVHRWPDAIESFAAAAARDPGNAASHERRGLILQYMGRFDEALAAFRLAHRIDPSAANAARLVDALRQLGDYDEAERTLDAALTRHPDAADLHYALAQLRLRAGDDAAAEIALRRAIELKPAFAQAFKDLAGVLFRQERTDEADLALLRSARLLDYSHQKTLLMERVGVVPGEPRLALMLAELELTEGRLDLAARWLERAEALQGPPERVALGRAELFGLTGDVAAATEAVAAARGVPAERRALAEALLALRNDDRPAALALLDSAGAASLDDRDYLRRLGDLNQTLGRDAVARELWKRAEETARDPVP